MSADSSDQIRTERDLYRQILALGHEDSLEPFLSRALELVMQAAGAAQGYLEVRGEADEDVWWISRGFESSQLEEVRARISQGIVARAISTGETIETSSALFDEHLGQLKSVQDLRLEAVLCVPIGGMDGVGVVYLQRRSSPGPFSRNDREQAEILAHHITPQVDRLVLRRHAEASKDHTRHLHAQYHLSGIVGRSQALASALEQAMLAAPLDVNVMIMGQNGTGKTDLAMSIHKNSRRAKGPFVELNCAAIPETLIESELFGAHAGAFANAKVNRDGLVAAAEGGTLFLDEIAEVPYAAQSKLLKLIQSKEYFRLGSNRVVKANVRIIAATNVQLEEAVKEKKFREDLYFRLCVVPIVMPPLDARRSDIPELASVLLERITERNNLTACDLSLAATRWLEMASWPGNVRQLENVLEQAAIRAHGLQASQVEVAHLSPDSSRETPSEVQTYQEATREFQRTYLLRALEAENWNITQTAKRIGIARQHVHNLIASLNIPKSTG